MKFDKVKYDNDYAKKNYDRIPLNVPKGQKEIIKKRSEEKGFKSVNDYIKDLIEKDINSNKNITVGDITQQGEGNSINIG